MSAEYLRRLRFLLVDAAHGSVTLSPLDVDALRWALDELDKRPACGAIDAVHGELGPVCTEPSGHDGDHVALDERGREVSRW